LTHGGGFVLGNVDSEHAKAVRWCGAAGCVVVSVDWRRAPENPFPAGLEDSYRALRWLVDQSERLGVDREGAVALVDRGARFNQA
jgi:acetyl esterase